MAAQLDTLTCTGCGAQLRYAAGLQALQCEYCETVMEIARVSPLAAATAAQLLIPMTIEENALACAVLQHLAANDEVPDDMVERAVLTVERFYMPCFSFKGSFNATWTASFGYKRTETYTAHVDRRVDGRTQRVALTRNRTVVDWRPVNGHDAGNFNVVGYGGSGLAPSVLPLLARLRKLPQATPFDVGFVSGVDTQPYTLDPKEAYALHTEAQVGKLVEASVMRHAQGDQQRDWHWNASSRWDASAVYVPVGHVMIGYEGRQYHAWADGTDAANLVTDALPANKGKENHIFRGLMLPLAATSALMIAGWASSSFFHALTWERVAMVGAAWILWGWREVRRAMRAKRSRQAALARRALRYAQPATTPAPAASTEPAAPAGATDWFSVALSTVSSVIVCALIYKLATGPAAPAPEAAGATAAAAAAAAAAPLVPPAPPLSPIMAAAEAQDWAAVRTMTAKTAPRAPVSKADKAASAAAFSRGTKALANKNHAAAITAFEAALEANGANMDARGKLGAALIRAGQHARARQVLGELVAAAPGHVEGWRNLAEAAALAGHPAEADASLRMLLHLSKDRKRSTEALRKRAAAGAPDRFSEAIARVVKPAAKQAGK
ncbi:tetratricopeptide repeat protein [Massilia atriviolacea]|uniref:Tetratricopeptide repeat protein n=1 Tax=Massilia atriviolacea TaxID=2495579 RepID=A0A430HPH5_9BURK|nr:bacterial transcriptional activator domain-containing protein [Massilia atriviolacea]RSZ59418.1 tetratricopeptide repeat protein [Massilia atriviolacea]